MITLTYLRNKINTLTKLIALPRWLGPLITFIAIALNQALIELGVWPVQVAWLNLPVAFAATAGLRSGLVSAALVALYSIWLDPGEVQRTIIVPLSVMTLAGLVGWQTRELRRSIADALAQHSRADANQGKADIVDSVNGNLKLALGAIDILDSLRFGWDAIPDGSKLTMVEQARGKLADQVTLHRSFRQMAKERGFVLGEDSDG